jgi:hypothetical protein
MIVNRGRRQERGSQDSVTTLGMVVMDLEIPFSESFSGVF